VERFFNKIKQCRRIATRMINWPQTTLPSSNSQRFGFGWALMSPRPRQMDWIYFIVAGSQREVTMTLCIVWREAGNIKFASDSRLTFGQIGACDCGIKVVRIPFNIYGPDEAGVAPLILSGDIGMAFAGNAVEHLW
jgi:hypothetical protein